MPPMNHSLSKTKSQNHFRPLRPFPSADGKLKFHPTNPTIPTASSAEELSYIFYVGVQDDDNITFVKGDVVVSLKRA